MLSFFVLYFALNPAFSNEDVTIQSIKKYKIIKQNKDTKILELTQNGEVTILNKHIRDSVQWIYYNKQKQDTIIITRPMIAGPEKSQFWKSHDGHAVRIGETKCADHQIDEVHERAIQYRCFFNNPKDPRKLIEEKITFHLD